MQPISQSGLSFLSPDRLWDDRRKESAPANRMKIENEIYRKKCMQIATAIFQAYADIKTKKAMILKYGLYNIVLLLFYFVYLETFVFTCRKKNEFYINFT